MKVPNQDLIVMLNNQKCFLEIKQKLKGVFISIKVNEKDIIVGQIALHNTPVLFEDYRGFKGSIYFYNEDKKDTIDYTDFGETTWLKYAR